MGILDNLNLNLGFGRKLPLVLQTEAAECGLVCLAMVASSRGYRIDLQYLWKIFFVSFKGMNQTHYVVTITPELDHVMAYGKKEPL